MTLPFYDYDSDFFSTDDLLFLAGASGKAVEDTATGNPVTFETDLAKPLKSLVANFLPVQSPGTPSPDNILPITGWDAVNVFHTGKNLLELSQSNVDRGAYNLIYTEGKISVNSVGGGSSDYVLFKQKFPAGTYTMKGVPSGGVASLRALSDKAITGWTFNAYYNAYYKDSVSNSLTFTETEEFSIGIVLTTGTSGVEGAISDIQLEVGQTATAYEPYISPSEYSAAFPSTIYGGYVDLVTGEVWANVGYLLKNTADMNNGEDYPGWKQSGVEDIVGTNVNRLLESIKTNVTPVSSLAVGANTAYNGDVLYLNKSYFNKTQTEWIALAIDVQFIIPLPSPVLITTLTPQQINAIKGNNTVWSDANGDCSVTFLKKG